MQKTSFTSELNSLQDETLEIGEMIISHTLDLVSRIKDLLLTLEDENERKEIIRESKVVEMGKLSFSLRASLRESRETNNLSLAFPIMKEITVSNSQIIEILDTKFPNNNLVDEIEEISQKVAETMASLVMKIKQEKENEKKILDDTVSQNNSKNLLVELQQDSPVRSKKKVQPKSLSYIASNMISTLQTQQTEANVEFEENQIQNKPNESPKINSESNSVQQNQENHSFFSQHQIPKIDKEIQDIPIVQPIQISALYPTNQNFKLDETPNSRIIQIPQELQDFELNNELQEFINSQQIQETKSSIESQEIASVQTIQESTIHQENQEFKLNIEVQGSKVNEELQTTQLSGMNQENQTPQLNIDYQNVITSEKIQELKLNIEFQTNTEEFQDFELNNELQEFINSQQIRETKSSIESQEIASVQIIQESTIHQKGKLDETLASQVPESQGINPTQDPSEEIQVNTSQSELNLVHESVQPNVTNSSQEHSQELLQSTQTSQLEIENMSDTVSLNTSNEDKKDLENLFLQFELEKKIFDDTTSVQDLRKSTQDLIAMHQTNLASISQITKSSVQATKHFSKEIQSPPILGKGSRLFPSITSKENSASNLTRPLSKELSSPPISTKFSPNTEQKSHSNKGKQYLIAKLDYYGRGIRNKKGEIDLSFCKGDVMQVIERREASRWILVELNHSVGLVPDNYVEDYNP